MSAASAPSLKAGELSLTIPECEFGIGQIVTDPTPANRIEGVEVRPVALWPDDRGYFQEILRVGQGLAANFPKESTQVSCAVSYPGAIKAFHYHTRQSDCWQPIAGMFQVALVDLRTHSGTFGRKITLYAGFLRPVQILIPPGVAHGYKIIGGREGVLCYATDRFYDPSDEGRIRHNDPRIAYDWELQHK